MGRSGVGRRVLDLAADAAAAEAATMQPKAEGVKARRSWLLWEEATPRQRLALPRIASPRLPSTRPERDFSTLHELQPTREKRDPSLFSGAGHGITPLGPAKSNPNSKVELHRPTAAAPTPRPHRWQPQAYALTAERMQPDEFRKAIRAGTCCCPLANCGRRWKGRSGCGKPTASPKAAGRQK